MFNCSGKFEHVQIGLIIVLHSFSYFSFHRTKGGKALDSIPALKDDKKNNRFEFNGNKLIIKKLSFDDDGKYECTNPATKESAEINVVGKQDNVFDCT